MSITRGATITNVFDVSIDLTDAVVLYITYKQYGRTVLEKQLEDCTVTQDKITVGLTQAESLKFAENKPVQIQIRATPVALAASATAAATVGPTLLSKALGMM